MSLLVWRDAKSDPPTLDGSYLVKDGAYPTVLWGYDTEEGAWFVQGEVRKLFLDPPTFWAERPVLSDLTDEDVRLAADCIGWESYWALGKTDGSEADRLRAALGGEKEEA